VVATFLRRQRRLRASFASADAGCTEQHHQQRSASRARFLRPCSSPVEAGFAALATFADTPLLVINDPLATAVDLVNAQGEARSERFIESVSQRFHHLLRICRCSADNGNSLRYPHDGAAGLQQIVTAASLASRNNARAFIRVCVEELCDKDESCCDCDVALIVSALGPVLKPAVQAPNGTRSKIAC
jgi:hypothetical protein